MPSAKATMTPRETVAAFDFDGTLTAHDSFFRFLAWRRSPIKLTADLVMTSPLLILYAARLVGNETHKMAMFSRQFAGVSVQAYQQRAREFSQIQISGLIRPEAMHRLKYHQTMGHKVVIVTASLTDWISPWAESQGIIQVIGSEAEIDNGRLTGRLKGANCHGPEKVRRLLALYPNRSTYTLHAYGDSTGDKALLAVADHAFYRRFT